MKKEKTSVNRVEKIGYIHAKEKKFDMYLLHNAKVDSKWTHKMKCKI